MTTISKTDLRQPEQCSSCNVAVRTVYSLSAWEDNSDMCGECLLEMLTGRDVEIAWDSNEEVINNDS